MGSLRSSQKDGRRETRRTPNDVSALCVELLRAVREQEFRMRHQDGPAPSVDRAWRAWRTDLDRHGPLHLVADDRGLHESGDGPPVGRGRLDELARRLGERVLGSVVFEPGLDAPTYAGFVSLLVADPRAVAQHGGAVGFLPERGVGIRIHGALVEEAPDADEPPKPDEDITVPMLPQIESPAQPGSPLDPTPAVAPCPSGTAALDAVVACRDDARYPTRVARLVAEACRQADDGDLEACHRALLVLAEHAEPKGGRSEVQRGAALGALREICSGRRLSDLVARAMGPDREAGLRASRVLLLLAEQAAPALLSTLDVEADPGRREELLGIAIALGRAATPVLHRAMEGSSPNRARIAARIAGEIRDERTVPALANLLEHRDADVRGEAARALARIGNVAALTSLKGGLASRHDDVSSLCAYCLGVTGAPEAARALTETLREARRDRRLALAASVIRSLGQLGREEPVPELKRILEKRSFFRRQEIHELKLQAVAALAKLPGTRAGEVLRAVAAGSDMSLAVAARRALNERTEADR